MMTWRNAYASNVLVDEVNARWPGRSKVSDGTIGDAAHASRSSDHNPWVKADGVGVVRARDITANGVDAEWLAEHFRQLGILGDNRLTGGGYVIYAGRIASEREGWRWRNYTGSNQHHSHVHISFSRDRAGYDSRRPWGIAGAAPKPKDWLTMATEQEVRDIVRTELDRALAGNAGNAVAQDIRSIKRHTVVGADVPAGSDPVPRRIIDSQARLEAKVNAIIDALNE